MIEDDSSPHSEQLPSWWLQGVLHDTREEQLRLKRRARREKAGLPPETENEENRGIEEEMRLLDTMPTDRDSETEGLVESAVIENAYTTPIDSSYSAPIGDTNYSNDLTAQSNFISKAEFSEQSDPALKGSLKSGKNMTREEEEEAVRRRRRIERAAGGSMRMSITMTSEEEAATVKYRRSLFSSPSQILGPNLLKSRRGNIKTIRENKDMDTDDEIPEDCLIDNYTPGNNRGRASENASQGGISENAFQGRTPKNASQGRLSENVNQSAVPENVNRRSMLKNASPVSSKEVIKNVSPIGPNLLKSRRGNIKTIRENKDMDTDDEIPEDCLIDNYTLGNNRGRAPENASQGGISENVFQGRTPKNASQSRLLENVNQSAVPENVNRRSMLKNASPVSPKDVIKNASPINASPISPKSVGPSPVRKHNGLSPVRGSDSGNKKAFVGGSFSHFDFAMQQRALQKERREKERHARESLATHHGASLEFDRVAKLKAKEKEERKKRMEADFNLKSFKAANLNTYTAELKKLQIKDKMKKKEAEENLKGYRER